MKQTKLFIWIIAITLLTCSTILADVKIKTRTTVADQTSESTVYIKGKRQRSEHDLGGIKTVNLTQCDLRRDVQMNTQAKTYFISLYEGGDAQTVPNSTRTSKSTVQNQKGGVITTTVSLRDTGERKQMFGYTARRILTTIIMESSPDACSPTRTKMETDGWYIDAEFAFECLLDQQQYKPETSTQSSVCQDRQEFKRVGTAKLGYPVYLKTTMRGEGGEDFTTVMEVLEISPATLDAALFEIPAGFRQIKNSAEIFTGAVPDMDDADDDDDDEEETEDEKPKTQASNMSVKNIARSDGNSNKDSGAKKSGVIRIGVAPVKTGSVGEGISADELSAAVKNTLAEYLKDTNVELVPIEAKLTRQIAEEAGQKSCDFVFNATVSHKKGGGGFGSFIGKLAPVIADSLAVSTGSVEGNAAINAGRGVVYTAGDAAQNVRAKDELTLAVNLQSAENAAVFNKQYKAKARSDGEDILSPLIEQLAQAILQTISK